MEISVTNVKSPQAFRQVLHNFQIWRSENPQVLVKLSLQIPKQTCDAPRLPISSLKSQSLRKPLHFTPTL